MDTQVEDFDWFIENYQDLFKKYGDCYLAIKNKEVLGSYQNRIDAIKTTAQTETRGTFIVQKCNGDESGYTEYFFSPLEVIECH